MSPVTSPPGRSSRGASAAEGGGGSGGADDREAAVEARMARMRAQNLALMRRHREVEEDRKKAEKKNSAIHPRQVSLTS